MPVPAATPARAFFAPGSPCAKPKPPITIATRLATFAMVPVKRLWIAVKPVSNGDPCANANEVEERTFDTQVGERLMQTLEDSVRATLLLWFVWHNFLV